MTPPYLLRYLAPAILLLAALLPPPASAQYWSSHYERNDFLFAPASTFRGGFLGATNPASAQAVEQDMRIFWTSNPRDIFSLESGGIVAGGNGVSLGAIHRRGTDLLRQPTSATEIRTALAGGNESVSAGVGFDWIRGKRDAFGLTNLLKGGLVVRPNRYLSLSATGLLPIQQNGWENVIEVGLRPLGTEHLTLFADGVTRSAFLSHGWSAGASIEIAQGIDVVGRYFDNDTFTAGLTLNFGTGGVGGHVTSSKNTFGLSSTEYIRIGQYEPNIFSERLGAGSRFISRELNGPVTYRESPLSQLFGSEKTRLYELLDLLRTAGRDERVSVVLLNLSTAQLTPSQTWEIREEIRNAQASDTDVIVYLEDAGMYRYHLASVADHVVMDPMGMMRLPGYLSNTTYFTNALEKLGIGFEAWRYFEYKSAVEPFSQRRMSPADRRQRQEYMDDLYRLTRRDIATGRNVAPDTVDAIIDDKLILTAAEAYQQGLVDTLVRWNEAQQMVESITGEKKRQLSGMHLRQGHDVGRSWRAPARIALIYGIGATARESGMNARALRKTIEEAGEDNDIEAIVFRVDSPGGDPLAADLVAEALREASEKKPVIVSQGQVAGSGGYWVSMHADTIMATPATVTGSIGVIGGWIYDKGLSDKLGLTSDYVERGDHADLAAGIRLPLLGLPLPHRNLSPEEQDRVKGHIMTLYDQFVTRVAEGRDTSVAHVRDVAEGRIYSGTAGRDVGLVDTTGTMLDALTLARNAAGLEPDESIDIVERGGQPSWRDALAMAGLDTRNTRKHTDEPLLEYLRLFQEHQPDPLVLLHPGLYPTLRTSAPLAEYLSRK